MEEKPTKVVVTGLNIPFWDLVDLSIKLVFAAIPAGIVLMFVAAAVVALGVLGG